MAHSYSTLFIFLKGGPGMAGLKSKCSYGSNQGRILLTAPSKLGYGIGSISRDDAALILDNTPRIFDARGNFFTPAGIERVVIDTF